MMKNNDRTLFVICLHLKRSISWVEYYTYGTCFNSSNDISICHMYILLMSHEQQQWNRYIYDITAEYFNQKPKKKNVS